MKSFKAKIKKRSIEIDDFLENSAQVNCENV